MKESAHREGGKKKGCPRRNIAARIFKKDGAERKTETGEQKKEKEEWLVREQQTTMRKKER